MTLTKKLERFFLLFLFINPFLDIIGGMYLNLSETYDFLPGITPSLLIRMAVLALFALYILMTRDVQSILILLPIGIAWILTLVGQLMYYYSFSLSEDVTYIVRFAFNVSTVLVYYRVFTRSKMDKPQMLDYIGKVCVFSTIVSALGVIVPYLLNVGYATYGDRFGYRGSRGFFYSGNDITAILMMMLPIVFFVFLTLDRKKCSKLKFMLYAAAPAATMTTLMLIGTRTAFLSVYATAGVMGIYCLYMWCFKKDKQFIKLYLIIAIAFAVVFGVLLLLSGGGAAAMISESLETPEILDGAPTITAVLSGRNYKLEDAVRSFMGRLPYTAFFGVGRGTQFSVVEMDLFEVGLYYGIFGTIAMLWLYLKLGLTFVFRAFKNFGLQSITFLLLLGLTVGYFTMAGHVLFSVSSGFYFALFLIIAHLYWSPHEIDQAPLLK